MPWHGRVRNVRLPLRIPVRVLHKYAGGGGRRFSYPDRDRSPWDNSAARTSFAERERERRSPSIMEIKS